MALSAKIMMALVGCLLVTNILAEFRNTLKYKFTSTEFIRLEPNDSKTLLKSSADIYIKEGVKGTTELKFNIRNYQAVIETENGKKIDLKNCSSMKKAISAFEKPYMVDYNNGLLKSLRVQNNEPEISIAMKFLIAGFFQMNLGLARKTDKKLTANGTEIEFVGACPVDYLILKQNLGVEDSVRVAKNFDMSKCSELANSRANYMRCLGSICNPANQKGYSWKENANMKLLLNNGSSPIIQYITVTDNVVYKAWIGSSIKTAINIVTDIVLESTDESVLMPPFNRYDSVKITKSWYKDADRLVCWRKHVDRDLSRLYKALACGSRNENSYMLFYEKALTC